MSDESTAGDGGQAQALADEQPTVEQPAAGGEPQGDAGASSRPLRGDRKPRKRAKAKRRPASSSGEQLRGAPLKAQSAKLEKALGEVLTFPAVPAMMFAPDPASQAFLSQHFAGAGPRTAHELVAASESNPQLRAVLERLAYGSSMFTVAMALVAYAAPPALWLAGMRQQAAGLSMASQMDEAVLASMIAEREAAAQAAAERAAADAAAAQTSPDPTAAANGGAPHAPAPAPGAGPF